jgi:hypothetical protein
MNYKEINSSVDRAGSCNCNDALLYSGRNRFEFRLIWVRLIAVSFSPSRRTSGEYFQTCLTILTTHYHLPSHMTYITSTVETVYLNNLSKGQYFTVRAIDSEAIRVGIFLACILFNDLFNDGVSTEYGVRRRDTGWLHHKLRTSKHKFQIPCKSLLAFPCGGIVSFWKVFKLHKLYSIKWDRTVISTAYVKEGVMIFVGLFS